MGVWYIGVWELNEAVCAPADPTLHKRCDVVVSGKLQPQGRLVFSALLDNTQDPAVLFTHRERGEREVER